MRLKALSLLFLGVSARADNGELTNEEWWEKYGVKSVRVETIVHRRKHDLNNLPEYARIAGGWIEGSPTANSWIKDFSKNEVNLWHNFSFKHLHPCKELYIKFHNRKGVVKEDLQITNWNLYQLRRELRQRGFMHKDSEHQKLTEEEKQSPYIKYIYKLPPKKKKTEL
ncbi:Oidioi.mRNA.OKI2018_I69.PAR.g9899.t1.cds [Oikopleura dioica]|uniref:Oidioi.mRNA.OKI2018_I69.PAR.g9899.t1.cds n=1 Tax=Oikopleura dioica TaxID=34765 RepID=A0ABN7RVI5_OIKDI|nr:Oidioi.mRNA.OKI2018_I69.PAR.g9899.t1.cds [Oikopleura dioica]